MISDWNDAYAIADNTPDAQRFFDAWPVDAAAFREKLQDRAECDLAYGSGTRHRFDLFHPEGQAKGLVVFVHGGYWMRFDKSFWSHFANGSLAHGWSVAMPSYTLCPDISISGIVAEIGAAVRAASARVPGPIRLVGHSAGGHLVTSMVCDDTPLDRTTCARVEHVISISGVHDLRPLLSTSQNEVLGLTPASAAALSPALKQPMPGIPVTAWVGTEERPEFVRQTTLLANIWTGLGAAMRQVKEQGFHHFDVIDSLVDPQGAITKALLSDQL
ncbi:MAG: alpha/beta hydrolase [Pseudomonadota bacterium]